MMPEYLHYNQHLNTMNGLLNIVIVLLIVGWLIGYIGFGSMVGSLIHILLVLAVIGLLYRLFTGRNAKV
jgi:Ca2+-dependent lipid-binding protein